MEEGFDQLCGAIRACRICRDEPLGTPLPHEPRPVFQAGATAKLLIAGQAPGTRAHRAGRPFSDPSGDRLRLWLGLTPEVFYDAVRVAIVPMGFCFPGLDAEGGDLPPRPECAGAWRAKLLALLPDIECTLLVGRHAQIWHLGQAARASMTETVGAWRRSAAQTPRLFPLPHPSWRNSGWLKANPWFERELLPDLRQIVQHLMR